MARETGLQTVGPDALEVAGVVANAHAARGVFVDYRSRRAPNTLSRQGGALKLFGEYLAEAGAPAGDLSTDAEAWRGITWGLISGFSRWLLARGYAVGSVNGMLSVVKTYAGLAAMAGVLPADALALIRTVRGYRLAEARHIDEGRDVARIGVKKSAAVVLSVEQVRYLKRRPNTPQGRRDALLVHLLFDLGLRVGEVVGLRVSDVNMAAGVLRVERPKTGRVARFELVNGVRRAVSAYMESDAPLMADAPLLRASLKNDELAGAGMTREAVMRRVRYLGILAGVDGLSPHDARHFAATRYAARLKEARRGYSLPAMLDFFGWTTPAMALRYIEHALFANEGVALDDES